MWIISLNKTSGLKNYKKKQISITVKNKFVKKFQYYSKNIYFYSNFFNFILTIIYDWNKNDILVTKKNKY